MKALKKVGNYGVGEIMVLLGALLFCVGIAGVTVLGFFQDNPYAWLLLTPVVGGGLMFLGAWIDAL